MDAAHGLVGLAVSSGFRESGISSVGKRVIVGIRCSIRLEVPLGVLGGVMVSEEYVRYLVGIANEKMECNRKRTHGFFQGFVNHFLVNCVVEKDLEGRVMVDGFCDLVKECSNGESGIVFAPECSISVAKMFIVGEPVDKLFLWGHSACTLENDSHREILIFGGFGGLGRHARRNETLLFQPQSGMLKVIDVEGPPSPRMGHTSSMVGESVFVIGGRGDPTTILNDVWLFNTKKNQWRLLECSGSIFHPRHRHAAAVFGSKIYVFGGLNNDVISSSMYVLDTDNLQWSEIEIKGEWPCARHSHALVAKDSNIYLFGGYDGEKALSDLYRFDSISCLWKKDKTSGKPPLARFSHSMFIYKNYLGIVGGCPVRQHHQEMALLDLKFGLWKHMVINSVGKDLFVRSTTNVIGDDLIIIGGGASCYAFGTKFSEPMKMSLLPSLSITDTVAPLQKVPLIQQHEELARDKKNNILATSSLQTLALSCDLSDKTAEVCGGVLDVPKIATNWVLRLDKKHAKFGKDILKKFKWLDLGRKVYCSENQAYVCLPVTEYFYSLFHEKPCDWVDSVVGLNDYQPCEPVIIEKFLVDDVSIPTALNKLLMLGGSFLKDDIACNRKAPVSPQKVMSQAVESLIIKSGLPHQLVDEIPSRWERLGDIVVLPVNSFKDPLWSSIEQELWSTVAKSLGTTRLARQGRIASNGTRDSTLDMLVGDDGWVDHRENGILYSFDATKCMFSWGNLSEKLRMARLDCKGEVIVDLFAGIGYFVLPFLVRANAKMVYACEWNPHALAALERNVQSNSVADQCVILGGDNRDTAPKGIADRVCLGLLPSSECSWLTAVRALRIEGGMLHVHGNVKDSEEKVWSDHVAKSIHDIAKSEGLTWEVSVQHLERVKWYGPCIRHLVADVRCTQLHL